MRQLMIFSLAGIFMIGLFACASRKDLTTGEELAVLKEGKRQTEKRGLELEERWEDVTLKEETGIFLIWPRQRLFTITPPEQPKLISGGWHYIRKAEITVDGALIDKATYDWKKVFKKKVLAKIHYDDDYFEGQIAVIKLELTTVE